MTSGTLERLRQSLADRYRIERDVAIRVLHQKW
jgi:hypothetical protein